MKWKIVDGWGQILSLTNHLTGENFLAVFKTKEEAEEVLKRTYTNKGKIIYRVLEI